MRNRGQFKIHRGVRLSRVYKSVYHKEDSRCSTMFLHPLFPITSKGRRASNLIDRFNGLEACLCANYEEEILLPWKLNKQSSSFYVRAWRMLMKFLVVFSLFLRLSLLSPLFFALIFLQFVAVDIATPSISSLNCLLLSTPVSSHPTFSSVSTSFLRVHADSPLPRNSLLPVCGISNRLFSLPLPVSGFSLPRLF